MSALPAEAVHFGPPLRRLPLVTLYLSERCNSRCVTCDYWRHGRADMNLSSVRQLIPDLVQLRTEVALISGGEPLLNPEWVEIAQLLRANGLKLWLLTSGLSLAKHVHKVVQLFDSITVSLDGTCRETYAAIRGLDAFDNVCAGIRAATAAGALVSVRVTLQRANYRELPRFVELGKEMGVRQVSFLPVDVSNPHAFGRTDGAASDLALRVEDLPVFEQALRDLERDHAEHFHSALIAESPQKLQRILQYFEAILGRNRYPAVRCNAPEFSAVIDANGRARPCFFIPGPPEAGASAHFERTLNDDAMLRVRASIRAGDRHECVACVCPLWRDPHNVDALILPPSPVTST